MIHDSETQLLLAREHAAGLRASRLRASTPGRTRRWLSGRLIELGLRLAAEANAGVPAPRIAV